MSPRQLHAIRSRCGPHRRNSLPCVNPWTGLQITLHQGAIEAIFLDSMRVHGAEVERPRRPSAIEISEDVDELSSPSSYPVKVSTNPSTHLLVRKQ